MPKLITPPEDKLKKSVLANIEYQCKLRDISTEEQRIIARCSLPTYNRKRKDPGKFTLDELIRLATKFKMSVSELLKEV